MTEKKHKYPILRFCVAAILVAVIILCFSILVIWSLEFNNVKVACADSALKFTIVTEEGYNWSLLLDGEPVAEFSGEWADPPHSDVASVVFESKIKEFTAQSGKGYMLDFELPEITHMLSGRTEFEYTQTDGGLEFRPVYSPIISEDVYVNLQYKTQDGEYTTYGNADHDGSIAFGSNVDVGSYDVRLVAYERFIYDGVQYLVARYGAPVRVTVTPSEKPAPSVNEISIEYGVKAIEISNGIYSADGKWILSDAQSFECNAQTVLGVREESYLVKFDFIHNNENFKRVNGIEIPVSVKPRKLRIYIEDAFSIVGAPLKNNIGWEITTPLADGDRIEELGVHLYVENADGTKAGNFIILATFENPNYVPECKSYQNPLLAGGTYTVYATTLTAKTDDGVEFTVFIGSGFEDLTLSVQSVDIWQGDTADNMKPVAAYSLIFENSDGDRVSLKDYSLEVNAESIGATHMSAGGELISIEGGSLHISDANAVLTLFAPMYTADMQIMTMTRACLALGIIGLILCAVFAVLIAVYSKGGRKC